MSGGLTYTVAEAAARLDVTPDWLSKAANRGIVPSRKVGHYRRFTEQDLVDYLDSVRQGAPVATSAGTPLSRSRRRAS